MTTPVLFPAFSYGDRPTVQRRMKAEAKKWGKRYAKTGDFPEPTLIPVPPGSVMTWLESALHLMHMRDSAANDPEWAKVAVTAGPKAPRWHLYMVDKLRWEIPTSDDRRDTRREMFDAFDAFICQYPWGALSVALTHRLYNTIPVVTRRVEALLSFWEQLDTLRYLDHRLKPVSLAELVAFQFQSEVAMWVDHPLGLIQHDLRSAITRMNRASDDEIRSRLVRRLREVADIARGLKHRDWLKSPGRIEARFEDVRIYGQEWYDDLETGNFGVLAGFLSILERQHPDNAHLLELAKSTTST